MTDEIPDTRGKGEVLKLSWGEACRLGATFIGPEHILLAIIRMGDGRAAEALVSAGIDLAELRAAIEAKIEVGDGPTIGRIPLSADAELVVEASRDIATSMKHTWVGTEHLLLSLIQRESTIPSDCLRAMGMDYERAVREVEKTTREGDV